MPDLQEIFTNIKDKQKEGREIKAAYRDALAQSTEYKDIADQILVLREKKKTIENSVQADFAPEFEQLDKIKDDVNSDREMLSDLALNQLMKGETVEIVDKYNIKYEPQFIVNFKKSE